MRVSISWREYTQSDIKNTLFRQYPHILRIFPKTADNQGIFGLFSHFSLCFFDTNASPRYNPPPMSGQHQRLPLEVDPFRLATKQERFQGTIPLKQMKRLVSALQSDEGDVAIDIEFGVDFNRVTVVGGKIETSTRHLCQRCMEEMTLPIAFEFELAMVRSEAEMDMLPDGYEATLIEDTPVMLSDLIEDEILLMLPTVPKHDEQDCSADFAQQQPAKETPIMAEDVKQDNPFEILANLKKDR